jgi:hypothetical protein
VTKRADAIKDWQRLHAAWRAWAANQGLTAEQFLRGSALLDDDPTHWAEKGWPSLERAVRDEPAPREEPWRVRV